MATRSIFQEFEMNSVRLLLALLALLGAVMCVFAWAVEEAPQLAIVSLPIKESEIPFGALPMGFGLFFLAYVVHPKGAAERRRD
jgi:hypothetical protein